ncbi:CST complex subunit CTC1-like [Abrus precatorius]|uniref:CST complex subunit CTC1 n=1 Tax=Abrus precatorius TaxID=3816 RepID=A0A8B8LK98_ABRPR|nr:CST complex subunit CTC1-like [Abrus precatorius]
MEDSTLRLADLLRTPRPVTASSSLPFNSTPSPPPQRSANHRVLTTLNRPTVIVGTLTLPTPSRPSSCSCFRFSDASATVCCDLLRFRAAAVGKEIRVTRWNFIPFKHHRHNVSHGFLEIIDWCFDDPNEGSNPVDSLLLMPNDRNLAMDGLRSVHGVVESVDPLSVVPCTMAVSGSNMNSGPKVNMPGFLVQLMCCECRLCGTRELLINKLNENRSRHSFTKLEIVYFCGDASSWHPAITKLIGNRIVVSGLKKKIVYVTKEESRVMYVTVDMSVLHVGSCSEKCVQSLNGECKGNGECGTYTGVIKGVYMQGMALELDHDVWLLLTDQLQSVIHGLRVGSIISVRNVHFVDPKFSWTKVIILGACVKTSVTVQSFSPLETVCNVVLQSTGKLGKFIQSLPFSARLWVLLLVSSLRKKFAGILSDKEILGSKHKEGLAQMYASLLFPPSVLQTQHDVFIGLRSHDLNGCGRELHCGFLKLVIPMSIFFCHCIYTLLGTLKLENHSQVLPVGNYFSILSHKARNNGRSVRRILRSEDLGVVLLGHLKIDPFTRRLQLVDATGGIDVFIPDLPLTWNPNEMYEVMDYDVFVDSIGELDNQSKLLGSESLSCRTIFNCSQVERELRTSIFVFFLWKNAKRRKFPLYSCIHSENETETLEPGSYHLLRVSHKFPLQEKIAISSTICSFPFLDDDALAKPFFVLDATPTTLEGSFLL